MEGIIVPRLIIVCGLPGSGKTSHARQMERNLRAIRFCPDEWMVTLGIGLWESDSRQRVEQLQWKIAQELLGMGLTVILEWGSWARAERDVLRMEARRLGAAVELHFLDAPVEVLFERVRQRNQESPPITLEDIKKWSGTFERPTPEEIALFDMPSTCLEALPACTAPT